MNKRDKVRIKAFEDIVLVLVIKNNQNKLSKIEDIARKACAVCVEEELKEYEFDISIA